MNILDYIPGLIGNIVECKALKMGTKITPIQINRKHSGM